MMMLDRADTSATSKVEPKRALLRFERLPALYIHHDRLSQCLPRELSAKHRERLLNDKRLRSRLSKLLIQRFNLRPCALADLETPEGHFALLEGERLDEAIKRIGAIWHARTIAAIILASALKDLMSGLGRDIYRDALRDVDLAVGGIDQDIIGETPNIDQLFQNIVRDGQRCIRAWCDHQPASLADRLILKLDLNADPDQDRLKQFQDRGLIITDRVMISMVTGHQKRPHR